MGRKQYKKYTIDSEQKCIFYLWFIIGVCIKNQEKFKRYNKETKRYLELHTESKLSYDDYCDFRDKTGHVISHLLNILGDMQNESISYKKYREEVEHHNQKSDQWIRLEEMPEDIKSELKSINRQRNFYNHWPESFLMAELLNTMKGGIIAANPLIITTSKYVTREVFENMYENNRRYYSDFQKIIRFIKKDYEGLFPVPVMYENTVEVEPIGMDSADTQFLSAEIQGMESEDGESYYDEIYNKFEFDHIIPLTDILHSKEKK